MYNINIKKYNITKRNVVIYIYIIIDHYLKINSININIIFISIFIFFFHLFKINNIE